MERLLSQDVPIGATQVGLAQLNERSRDIFRQIVESYLATGDPVGSRNISRLIAVPLSPASVRNVMSDLEALGLIYAPHTSAGRLPTELGLRFFVDALMQIGDLTEAERQSIQSQLVSVGRAQSVEAALGEALTRLSGLTRAAAVVLTAKSNSRLKHIEFVRLEPGRALVVLVGEDGQVENRVLSLPPGVPSSALTEATNFLNARIRGRTLAEARLELETALAQNRAELDQLTQKVIAAGIASWSGGENDDRQLIVRGHANLLEDLHALEDLERVRLLFDDLETKRGVIDLLGRAERAEGARIFIGSENKLFSLSGSSTIVAPYRDGAGRIIGVIGVIGPTRLNYARVIPMVDYTAEMENLRRRTEREVVDARLYGIASFARDILAVADNMDRALAALDAELREKADAGVKALLDGVELTERELLKVLEKHGVKKFEPQGEKFDPNLHQAMYEVADPALPAGTVAQVVQAGYMIGERILRPALVVVARGGAKASGAGAPANDN